MTGTSSTIDKARALLTIAATLGTIAFNWLAAAGRVGGVSPAEISAKYPTVITPAGYAFSIWSLIYIGLLAFSVYQILPRNLEKFRPVRSLYIFSAALNCAWIFFWHSDQIAICLAIIAALFVVLLLICFKLRAPDFGAGGVLAKGVFGIYLGWVSTAMLVNLAVLLRAANVDLGNNESIFGAAMALIAAGFGIFASVGLRNQFVPVAIAWGLTAIAVKQSGKTIVVAACAVGVVACLIAALSFVVRLPSSAEKSGDRI